MRKRSMMTLSAISFLLLFLFALSNVRNAYLDIDFHSMDPAVNTLSETLHDRLLEPLRPELIGSHWDSYSRIDVMRFRFGDSIRNIFINCGTPTQMPRFDGDFSKVAELAETLEFFPLMFGPREHLLNIGSGGGYDVLLALMAGFKRITAVDIDPGVIRTALNYSDYNGGIYLFRNVDVVVDDGRSFVKRSELKYDHILLSLASTVADVRRGGIQCREDYLHTVEAFEDYFNSLNENGSLSILIHKKFLLEKLILTAFELFENQGLSHKQASRHIVALSKSGSAKWKTYGYLFMMRKAPYTRKEAEMILSTAEERGHVPLLVPYLRAENPARDLITGRTDIEEVIERSGRNIAPSRDQRPFFFMEDKTTPVELDRLLTATAILAAVFLLCGIINVGMRRREEGSAAVPARDIALLVAYFVSLGCGFIIIEVCLVQRFILFLGYPTLSLSVIVFSLLIGGGLGGLTSNLVIRNRIPLKITLIALLICLVVLIHFLFLPYLFEEYLEAGINVRSLLSIGVVLPLGFLMGMPFPLGIRAIEERLRGEIPYMWAVNGIFSVVGSVAGIIIAIHHGFEVTLLTGILFYLWIGLLWWRVHPRRSAIDEQ